MHYLWITWVKSHLLDCLYQKMKKMDGIVKLGRTRTVHTYAPIWCQCVCVGVVSKRDLMRLKEKDMLRFVLKSIFRDDISSFWGDILQSLLIKQSRFCTQFN